MSGGSKLYVDGLLVPNPTMNAVRVAVALGQEVVLEDEAGCAVEIKPAHLAAGEALLP